MIKIKEAIIVEGKYDKIRISNIYDTLIIITDGFSLFHNIEKISFIKKIASEKGVVILTDSDSAGLQIRKFIKDAVKNGKVYDVYLPEIEGKEKRKRKKSSAGLLGVEGISDQMIIKAFESAGITTACKEPNVKFATTSLLYQDGLIGKANSSNKRKEFLYELDLPTNLSTSDIISVLNSMYSLEDYKKAIEKINRKL